MTNVHKSVMYKEEFLHEEWTGLKKGESGVEILTLVDKQSLDASLSDAE